MGFTSLLERGRVRLRLLVEGLAKSGPDAVRRHGDVDARAAALPRDSGAPARRRVVDQVLRRRGREVEQRADVSSPMGGRSGRGLPLPGGCVPRTNSNSTQVMRAMRRLSSQHASNACNPPPCPTKSRRCVEARRCGAKKRATWGPAAGRSSRFGSDADGGAGGGEINHAPPAAAAAAEVQRLLRCRAPRAVFVVEARVRWRCSWERPPKSASEALTSWTPTSWGEAWRGCSGEHRRTRS